MQQQSSELGEFAHCQLELCLVAPSVAALAEGRGHVNRDRALALASLRPIETERGALGVDVTCGALDGEGVGGLVRS